VHFNHEQSVSNPLALNTEIVKPQEKLIFSHDVCFNSSTDMFNESGRFARFTETINRNKVDCMCMFPNNEIYVKLESARDGIDRRMFCMDETSDLYNKYQTMIVTYQKDDRMKNDTDYDEYQTPRLYRSKYLNYESSVITDRSSAHGHFKESNFTPNDSYTYNLKDFDMIKAVADK